MSTIEILTAEYNAACSAESTAAVDARCAGTYYTDAVQAQIAPLTAAKIAASKALTAAEFAAWQAQRDAD